MRLEQKSPEVFLSLDDIASIGQKEIDLLKTSVEKSALGRVRINLHPSSDDTLHEMFIVIKHGSYIRPHKHPNKSEAFHLVHGEVLVVIFTDEGDIHKVVHLKANSPDKPFYYRMSKPYFHTVIILSDILIMHEITNGPFIPGGTLFASFAPDDKNAQAIQAFQSQLQQRIQLKETV